MESLRVNPDIDVSAVEGGTGLRARHKRNGHWAVYHWPGAGEPDMVFHHGHCDDAHYWTYDKFRTEAHIAVNAHARQLGRPK